MQSVYEKLNQDKDALINRTLLLLAVVATFGVAGSFLRIMHIGWQPAMGFHIAILLATYGMALFRRRTTLNVKLTFILTMLFSAGVVGLFNFGLVGGALVLFMLTIILASTLATRRVALLVWLLSAGTVLLVGILMHVGLWRFSIDIAEYHASFSTWILMEIVLLFFGFTAYQIVKSMNDVIYENLELVEWQRKELEKSDAIKDKVFSVIAHDLKRPFSGLVGLMQLLSEGHGNYSDEQKTELFQAILTDSTSVYELLEDLLLWSQTQMGAIEISKQNVEAGPFLTDCIAPYRHVAEAKGVTLSQESDSAATVFIDPSSMRIVVGNLISNAIKFTHPGGVITVSYQRTATESEIGVTDTGVGIEEEKLSQMLEGLSLRSTRGTGNESGTGLGLRLCQDLVAHHGCTFRATSKPGVGSVFVVVIPHQ